MKAQSDLHVEQAQLQTQGYITLPFLRAEECQQLTAFYFDCFPDSASAMSASSHDADIEKRRACNNFILNIVIPHIQQRWPTLQSLGATYMTKPAGPSGILPIHQDWTVVNEPEVCSYNLWIPLHDVDANNGTIRIIPGSHKWSTNLRGYNLPNACESAEKWLASELEPVCLSGGDALLYDHRLIHDSALNLSATPRLVIVIGLIPIGAQLLFLKRKGTEIHRYVATPEFYLYESPENAEEQLPLLDKIPLHQETLFPPNTTRWKRFLMRFMWH
ncbi:MAG: phytanoyl-CoA dioxygenase family protein [Chitinophagales bacterium]